MADVRSLFAGDREVFVSISYLYNSPCMNYALLRSHDELRLLVERCPDGAELSVWKHANLPFRGVLTNEFLEAVRSSIPGTSESVCLFTDSRTEGDPRLEGDSWHLAKHMLDDLKERMGERVAIGPWPVPGSIRAIKAGIDGPR